MNKKERQLFCGVLLKKKEREEQEAVELTVEEKKDKLIEIARAWMTYKEWGDWRQQSIVDELERIDDDKVNELYGFCTRKKTATDYLEYLDDLDTPRGFLGIFYDNLTGLILTACFCIILSFFGGRDIEKWIWIFVATCVLDFIVAVIRIAARVGDQLYNPPITYIGSMSSPSSYESNYESRSSRESNDTIDYVPQRLGGTGWLNVGCSFSSVNGAISSVEHSKRTRPNDPHRVAERRNGKIVGTVYSC